jgi:uncharacterized protein (DUF302 family)
MYERVNVSSGTLATVAQLRRVIVERGFIEYAVVDHRLDMAEAGAPAFDAWTVIFGAPAAGSRLLAIDLAAAVDIPLRLAVIAAGPDRSDIVFRDMRSLLTGGPLTRIAEGMTDALRAIAIAVRDSVEGGHQT